MSTRIQDEQKIERKVEQKAEQKVEHKVEVRPARIKVRKLPERPLGLMQGN